VSPWVPLILLLSIRTAVALLRDEEQKRVSGWGEIGWSLLIFAAAMWLERGGGG